MMDSKFWRRYEKGRDYLDRKDLVNRSNKCWNFFIGNQWEGLEADGEELPMFNFIHPNVMRKVTTIYTNRMAVNYSDMDGRAELQPIYRKLSEMFSAKWEKANEDVLCRKSLKHGAVTGDGYQYFPSGDVEDVQILLNTDIMFGDESEPNVQRQPFIIIQERRSVEEVKKLARENGISEEEIALIQPDRDTDYVLGNTEEVESSDSSDSMKVTMITHFEKKKEPITMAVWNEDSEGNRVGQIVDTGETRDVVYIARCTKTAMVEEERPIKGKPSELEIWQGKQGRALSLYPIIKFSWEEYPNDARGVSQVEALIPNQLLINKTLARRSMTTKNTAYPRMAYDETLVSNPDDLMKVGMPIAVTSGGAQSVNQAVSYLNPAQSNDEPKKLTDDLLEITQELSGSGDTTMGNIDLSRVAASAIIAVNDQAQSMHDDTVANLQLFVEDMANLWVELWQVFSPNGLQVVMKKTVQQPVTDQMGQPVIDPMTGVPQMQSVETDVPVMITAEELDQIKPITRIDVTKDNSFTREAQQQVIDNLLSNNLINLEEWTELATETSPVPKHALQMILERRKQQQQEQMMQQQIQQQQMQEQMIQQQMAQSNSQ